MKIASSNIALLSQHSAVTQNERKESLRMWIGDRRPDFEGRNPPPGRLQADAVHLSQAARTLQPSKQVAPADADMEPEDEPKLALLIRMIEVLTGKKIQLVSPKELNEKLGAVQEQAQQTTEALSKIQQQRGDSAAAPQSAGFGIEYDAYAVCLLYTSRCV